MAKRDDRAGVGEAVVVSGRARVLSVADGDDDVVAGVRDAVDHADVVRVLHGEGPVVVEADGGREGVVLRKLDHLIERPGRAVCEIRGWPGVPDLALRGLRIGIANVLVVAGRKNVRTESASTPDGARFEILWDP